MIPLQLVLVALLIAPPGDPGRPMPIITGIFPPGVTLHSETTWTITGRDLDGATAVTCDDPGLRFGPPRVAADGRTLSVAVAARGESQEPYPAIRVEGPGGASNLAIVRVDWLPQAVEVEPNDREPAPGQVLTIGSAVAGVIRPLDVDRYRVEGEPGRRVTLDWETRRLGTAILPVLTVTGPGRAAIRQTRGSGGDDRDCRAAVVIPPAGWFEVELRDNAYAGDDRARYRLRVTPEPFATGMFPLGGPAGAIVDLTLSGGTVPAPIPLRVELPPAGGDSYLGPGAILRASTGPADFPPPRRCLPPARLRVVDPGRPELVAPHGADPWGVPGAMGGVTINGRLDRPGAVARFRVQAKAGDRFRARVEAASAGSWLDSVVTVLGPRGEILGENDDHKPGSPLEPPTTVDGAATTDSEVDVSIREDGPITVELADRAGSGGPEYGYRLELGPPPADFALHLLRDARSADPGPEARRLAGSSGRDFASVPGAYGVYNLAPGTTTEVPLVVVPRGRPGIIDIEAVDLPPGVQAERLTVRTAPAPRSAARGPAEWDAPVEVHALRLHVAPDAAPARGSFRVVATSRPTTPEARSLRRQADGVVGVDAAGGEGRPVVRRLSSFPIRVTGPPR